MNCRSDSPDFVIGIDPDVKASGYAIVDVKANRITDVTALCFPDLVDRVINRHDRAIYDHHNLVVVVEAGWINRSNWHITRFDSKPMAAKKGYAVGRNHETGRKIVEVLRVYGIQTIEWKPLALKVKGCYLWDGPGGKITAANLTELTGYKGRTNQEGRDAALLAWRYSRCEKVDDVTLL